MTAKVGWGDPTPGFPFISARLRDIGENDDSASARVIDWSKLERDFVNDLSYLKSQLVKLKRIIQQSRMKTF